MQFDTNIRGYFSGNLFSNGLNITISSPEKAIIDRISFLKDISKDSTIIHVGCVDHVELIPQKLKNKTWLHEILTANAKTCIGIDINEQGINYLKKNLGYNNVYHADIINDNISFLGNSVWDCLILGEILEHVLDPHAFLSALASKFRNKVKKVLITAPNAFSFSNIRNVLKQRECINTDHKFWFTPYTLAALVSQAGMEVESFHFCENYPPMRHSFRSNGRNFLLKRYPALRETLLMQAKL